MTMTISLTFIFCLALPLSNFAQAPSPSPSPTPEHSQSQPGRLRVSAGVAEALVRHKVAPVYPPEAKLKHITGDVVLHFVFDAQGNVIDILSTEGDPILAKAAVAAFRQWKYKPYTLNSRPVEVESVTTIHFKMR